MTEKRTSQAQREIDDNLKRAYVDMMNQDVPDRFTDLLAKLKAAEALKGSTGQEADK
jgi:DnaJ-domain-containing protein 1